MTKLRAVPTGEVSTPLAIPHGPYLPLNMYRPKHRLMEELHFALLGDKQTNLADVAIQGLYQLARHKNALFDDMQDPTTPKNSNSIPHIEDIRHAMNKIVNLDQAPRLYTWPEDAVASEVSQEHTHEFMYEGWEIARRLGLPEPTTVEQSRIVQETAAAQSPGGLSYDPEPY